MDAPLSVKRFLEQVKAKVEPGFAACCLVGEVSNARTSGRHWYFTLKEEGAALSCAVWSSQQRFLKATPKDGQRVVVKGSLGLYVPGGSLTFAVTHLEAAGTGDLQQRLRELEAALRAEGLFERPKRSLPRVPRRLGVVAALGGAALHDVLEVAGRRAPGLPILVAPAAAQGDRCVPEVLAALAALQDPALGCDVLLLVRGGGSLEDLWGYNDPALVRAVAACRLPVVTGVGHEIDTTLVDLAADLRAATPSQAAERATPDRAHLAAELRRRFEALQRAMEWRLQGLETELNLRVDHGLLRLAPDGPARIRLEGLVQRLERSHPQRRLDQALARLAVLRQRLRHSADRASGEADRLRVREAQRRMHPALQRSLEARARRLEVLGARLRGLDPRAPLDRGFVLALDGHGQPVISAQSLPQGSPLDLQWKDGRRRARVE